jgi:hypothetical protein
MRLAALYGSEAICARHFVGRGAPGGTPAGDPEVSAQPSSGKGSSATSWVPSATMDPASK